MASRRNRWFARWLAAGAGLAAATYGDVRRCCLAPVRPRRVAARAKFRRYWTFVPPGIMVLGPLKAEAERRARLLR